jgi:hypothetical protein
MGTSAVVVNSCPSTASTTPESMEVDGADAPSPLEAETVNQ